MKIKLSNKIVTFIFLLIICSCSNPDKEAEKIANTGVSEMISGKYAKNILGLNMSKSNMFDEKSVFYDNEINKHFIENGYKQDNEIRDILFQSDYLGSKYRIVETKKVKTDIFKFYHNISENISGDEKYKESIKLAIKITQNADRKKKNYTELKDGSYYFTEYENVDEYVFNYNIDDKRLAIVKVINHPTLGLKMSCFMYLR